VVSTKRFGAEVILHGASYDEASEYAIALQKKEGYVFIHPFEDELVIAGQGTLGLELYKDLPDADTVYIPIGGGGLLAGTATALRALNPKVQIVGVQAENFDSMVQSIRQKRLVIQGHQGTSIADGIAVKKPSARMYEDFLRHLVDDVVTVTDDDLARTIVFLMERAKTLVEGAGAAGLAALLSGRSKLKSKKSIAVLGGGNIDLNTLERVIDRGFQVAGRLAKITVTVRDVPGTLNRLTGLIAEKKANVLQIHHNRVSDRIGLRETSIEFTLETTGHEQIMDIRQGFEALGARLEKD
jgi:threonine dehydratase